MCRYGGVRFSVPTNDDAAAGSGGTLPGQRMQPTSLAVTVATKLGCAALAPIAPASTLPADARMLGSATEAIRIREATRVDREAIVAFDHVARSDPGRVRFIDRVLGSATCLVAEHHGGVVAYAALE